MDTYIGMVLSGTNLTIGEMDVNGNILKMKRYVTSFFNQEAALKVMCDSIANYRDNVGYIGNPLAVGIGVIGRVDPVGGIWQQIDPDRTKPIALAAEMGSATGMPCFIDNDVKGSARAVMRWGFGRISQNFIYIYVGTGIAASVIIDGKQIRGSHFNAGEVGHLRVGVQVGLRCPCGRIDCVETIASSIGFDRQARYLHKYYDTQLVIPNEDSRVSVAEVYRLAKHGDALCMKIVDNAAEALANLIMNMVRVSDPDTVVLGGEMVADGYLLDCIKGKLNKVTMRFVTNGVVMTMLNPQFINLLGAGAVAIDGMSENK